MSACNAFCKKQRCYFVELLGGVIMTEKHSRYQFKELILTAFVASTMVLFAFTSCQTKDEKAVIQFTKTQFQELTFKQALKFFGINRTVLAEQMTNYLTEHTQIEVVSHTVKIDKTIYTLKLNMIDGDELQGVLKLFAHNQEKYDFEKINFAEAMQILEKVEGRPFAYKDTFVKVSMKNNIQKQMSFESLQGQENQQQLFLSQTIQQASEKKRIPASAIVESNDKSKNK